MPPHDVYLDLKGRAHSLAALSVEERQLVAELQQGARTAPGWNEFDTFWTRAVADFYEARGLDRKQSRQTVVYRIGQDLSSRLGIAAGLARPPDYRDELEELIRTRFRTRRAFCEATGISEDMLSHVLARRKHLSIETLVEALARIGYTFQIVPCGVGTSGPLPVE
jgi:hypothetical protein